MCRPAACPHALTGWLIIAAWATAADVWLARHGHPTLSGMARHHRAVTAVGSAYLVAHFLASWRADPLRLLGDRLIRGAEQAVDGLPRHPGGIRDPLAR